MSPAAPRFDRYEAHGAGEAMIARGPIDAPQLLIVQPFFEEANFARMTCADLQRGAAAAGIGAWLFDLPGQGDSILPIGRVRLADWRDATAAAVARVRTVSGRAPHLATVRGGALIAPADVPCWRLAPAGGQALLRTMRRAAGLGSSHGIAGWLLSQALTIDLEHAVIETAVSGSRDVAWAAGAPPWHRAEPARDAAESARLSADLVEWIASCARR